MVDFSSTLVAKTIVEYDRVEAGKLARQVRRDNKLRLKELAKHMGCSIAYVSALESGRKRWTGSLVRRFEDAVQKILDERNLSGV